MVLLERDGDLDLRAAWPPEDALDPASMSAARWAFSHDEPAGAGTATLPIVPWLFLPLRTPRGGVGVLGVAQEERLPALDSEARVLLDTLAEQTAAALERGALARDMVSTRSAAETERVRNTLLASISHDFRTPLASILGSATSVLDYGDKLDEAGRNDLLDPDQGGSREPRWDGPQSARHHPYRCRRAGAAVGLARSARRRRSSRQARHGGAARVRRSRADLPADLPLVRADASLIEQAIGNIIGNAIAHTPKETRVVIDAVVTPQSVAVRITDDGPGIPADALPRVFEKFVRARRDSSHAEGGEGAGLGLAIAKGIIEAHGGSIAAESPIDAGRGTRITLAFSRTEMPS